MLILYILFVIQFLINLALMLYIYRVVGGIIQTMELQASALQATAENTQKLTELYMKVKP